MKKRFDRGLYTIQVIGPFIKEHERVPLIAILYAVKEVKLLHYYQVYFIEEEVIMTVYKSPKLTIESVNVGHGDCTLIIWESENSKSLGLYY